MRFKAEVVDGQVRVTIERKGSKGRYIPRATTAVPVEGLTPLVMEGVVAYLLDPSAPSPGGSNGSPA